MTGNLPLQIQTLGGFDKKRFVLGNIEGFKTGPGAAPPAEIRDTFLKLRLPKPANVNQHLAALRREHLVMQPSGATWAVTPLGVERIRRLMEGISDEKLARLGGETGEPSFGEATHHLIYPTLAPSSFQQGIARFLEGHAFDANVFGMSRFPGDPSDPVAQALGTCRAACAAQGLEFHLASDPTLEHLLFSNVAAAMWASRYGIAVLENRAGRGLNHNVIFEVGAMLVTGRRCLLLKDESVPDLPSDLVGHIYVPVTIDDRDAVTQAVEDWITKSLGI